MRTLSRDEEAGLFVRARAGDETAREQLVVRYLPLAGHVAARFHRGHAPFDDLFQVASYGLVKAIDRFDSDRGLAFSSYAVPTMSGELKRFARDTGWAMRVPRALKERVLKVEHAVADLTARYGASPTPARIAEEMGLTREEVLEALDASRTHTVESLDARVGTDEDSATRLEGLGELDGGYELVDDAASLAPALRSLPERERRILQLRFGEELPQSEIARRLGVSQMHVSRLLRRTLDELSEQVEQAA